MKPTQVSFRVLFEDPFWVGICERWEKGRLQVCKVTFGAEPRDAEIYAFILARWDTLRFGPAIKADAKPAAHKNPKRRQREIQKQLAPSGVGTKAQQALKAQQQQGKAARKQQSRAQKQQAAAHKLALHKAKQKQKHNGH